MSSNPAQKKTAPAKKTTKAAEPVVAATPAAAAPSAPATSARSKATASAAATPAPVAAVVAAPVAAAAVAEEEVNLVAEFAAHVAKVDDLRKTLSTVLADMKKTEKRLARELKKAGRRRRTRAPQLDEAGNPLPKKPSVFTKPQQITDDLCVFLGKSKGTQLSRSDVTRGIMDYVKKHTLNNKQDINPDAALRRLLKVGDGEKVTILNLQRYLKVHYIKAVVPVA
jgi:chromatin remodeling complex protein RSC6